MHGAPTFKLLTTDVQFNCFVTCVFAETQEVRVILCFVWLLLLC